ncbi:Symplekin tight junction protein C terminal-domain-containing protein [Scenedesmus sp. NREL 46B-D3]|nr:Symplekin tight junction protein C terminal-domain-containing protein [Scenedesmus sp. NREL 46B-D3]
MAVLLQTYGKAGAAARAGMDRYAASLARAGSRELLLAMLHALTDGAPPPKQLVEACIASFAATKDAALLAPVTLVAQLSRPQLRLLYRRLTQAAGGTQAPPHFKPTELLVALHQVRSTPALRVTTKQQTAALDVALHAPEVFPVAVVVQAIRRLETLSLLPQLFMRTVISALQISPKLTDNVMELLKRLITKQIWTNEKQWQGFIICCEKAAPASYPVLLQLPPNILEAALEKVAERHWRELLKYATSKECTVPVFQPVRDVLNLFLERLANRQKARMAAAAAAAGGSAAAGGAAGDKDTPAAGGGSAAVAATAGASRVAAAGAKKKAVAGGSKAGGTQKQPAKAPAAQRRQRSQQHSNSSRGPQVARMWRKQLQRAKSRSSSRSSRMAVRRGDDFMLDFEDDE